MKTRLLLIFVMSVLGFFDAEAQRYWTLEDCINYALENNLQVKRQELYVENGKNNYIQSIFNTLPNMNGSMYNSYSSGKTIDYAKFEYVDQNYWSSNMQLSSNLTVFSGLQNYHNILLNRYTFLKNQADLDKARNDISLQLTISYLQILFARELENIARSRLEVTSMQVERMSKLLDAGNIAQGEYLQVRAQEANNRTAMINAGNNLNIAYLDLTQLLDLDSTGGFDIAVPADIDVELIAPLETVQNIYDAAVRSLPQIKSAEYYLKSSRKQLAMAWGQVSPTVSVSGSLSTRYSELALNPLTPGDDYPYLDQLNDYYYKQVSVVLSVPIFNRLQVRNSISNAKLGVNDAQLQLEMARKALYKEVQQAHADALASMEKYNSSLEAVKFNEEAFKYTNQQYELGLVNTVDYNLALNNLTTARSDMLQAKYEYIFKLKILDFYMNKPIVLN
ncbi:MAG: TolC family protein [Bacteroidales bacterium]|nr:TolC family protein [Bacteroidales bacterium]